MDENELTSRQRLRLWVRIATRLLLLVAIILLLIFAVPRLWNLLMPFALALLLAWMLLPAVRWLQKKLKLSRKAISMVLVILVFAAVGGIVAAFIWALVQQVMNLVDNWNNVLDSIVSSINSLEKYFDRESSFISPDVISNIDSMLARAVDWAKDAVPSFLNTAASRTGTFVRQVPSTFVAIVVFVMASYFFTDGYPAMREWITSRVSKPVRSAGHRVRTVFAGAFGGYIKSQLILSFGVFIILVVGFFIIRQSYGLLLAAAFAVLDFIPIIGAGTVMVPWAVVYLFMGNLRGAVQLLVIWGVIVLYRRVAEPKVLGDQTGLPPILSLIAIYVGMKLGGVWGMVLGPILALVLVNLGRQGVYDSALEDIRMAVADVTALLKNKT